MDYKQYVVMAYQPGSKDKKLQIAQTFSNFAKAVAYMRQMNAEQRESGKSEDDKYVYVVYRAVGFGFGKEKS